MNTGVLPSVCLQSIELPSSSHYRTQPMTQPFGAWLKDQQHRNDPTGDLAKDFLSACRVRKEDPLTKAHDDVRFQMACMSACSDAYEALEAAVAEWQASR